MRLSIGLVYWSLCVVSYGVYNKTPPSARGRYVIRQVLFGSWHKHAPDGRGAAILKELATARHRHRLALAQPREEGVHRLRRLSSVGYTDHRLVEQQPPPRRLWSAREASEEGEAGCAFAGAANRHRQHRVGRRIVRVQLDAVVGTPADQRPLAAGERLVVRDQRVRSADSIPPLAAQDSLVATRLWRARLEAAPRVGVGAARPLAGAEHPHVGAVLRQQGRAAQPEDEPSERAPLECGGASCARRTEREHVKVDARRGGGAVAGRADRCGGSRSLRGGEAGEQAGLGLRERGRGAEEPDH
mmetsp:Transcript_28812/g.92638  ORF Transcript_28812/g.92638 Transcript_28812/m.92638 type:complete len:301 (-) Transcript_28812:67-969(-)